MALQPSLIHALILIMILYPLFFSSKKQLPDHATKAIKTAFFLSIIPIFFSSPKITEASYMQKNWLDMTVTFIKTAYQFDTYANMFLTVALFVTWSILEFSKWYMKDDPEVHIFFKYLLIFLLAMMLLVSATNMVSLFVGWEGVGLMSFLLIGWYHGRNNAAIAAIQAVLYNRVGDIGFFITLCWMMKSSMFLNFNSPELINIPTPILISAILAAASKSAQFSLHPWLASAMEGPTPVSALLHSSTMVVAGIFLMIRMSPMIANNQIALTTCLCLGALSTMYAATSALSQNDIKKIIAYSTSSQLGLMMVAIGIGQPHFAFFHICTHAFFKAMLFLCSGLIIHNLDDEQDIRKMGGLQRMMPVTTTCLSIGSLALMGTPYLSGFYSKDAIIETMNTSFVNSAALIFTLIATAFTAVYSLRLIYYISIGTPRMNSLLKFNENDFSTLNSITRLALGSVVAGLYIFHTMLPTSPITHTMPIFIKLAALLITAMAFLMAYNLAKTADSIPFSKRAKSKLYDPLIYNQLLHRTITQESLNIAWRITAHLLEKLVVKKLTLEPLKNINFLPMHLAQTAQSGMIKTYLSTMLITLVMAFILVQIIW
nr:NADH dehydrogenase subunit 5 [Buergeria japonica]